MVVIQHLLGAVQILFHAGFGAPRDRQHPVEVIAHDGRLGAHRAHVLELLDLVIGLFTGFLGQLRVRDPLLQLGDLVLTILAVAQLLLDRLHLLVEIILALGPLHLGFHAGLDGLFHLQDGHLPLHHAVDLLQPLGHDERLQQFLLLLHLKAQMAGHKVSQLVRRARLRDSGQRLLGDVLFDLGVLLELLSDGAQKCLHRIRVAFAFFQQFRLGLEIGLRAGEIGDLHAALALHQHLHGTVGQLEQLQHIGQHAGTVDALGVGVIHSRVNLGGQQDLLVIRHHLLQRLHRFVAPHKERHDHMREHDDVAQGQHRVGGVELLVHWSFLVLGKSPGPA